MYVPVNEVLVTGYQLDATAAKNWKLQKILQIFHKPHSHALNTITNLMVYPL